MALRVVMLGAPGAGKGTQARRLARSVGIPHISTGDMFRQQIQDQTPLGQRVKPLLDNGKLVPDELTLQVLSRRLDHSDCRSGFILDGFPRTLRQAEALQKMMAVRETPIDLAIDIEVEDEEIVRRLSARRVCPKCGAIRNLLFDGPDAVACSEPGCEGTRLVQRDDDKEETVRERLRIYKTMSAPILEYYRRLNLLVSIEGTGIGPDAVFRQIEEIIGARGVALQS